MAPVFFATPAAFRAWLEAHHATAKECVVGFYKAGARRHGITHKEALDEALCFGWIDGVAHRLDDERWTLRFSPRRPRSHWSDINTRRAAALLRLGRMTPAGRKAFEARRKTVSYSFESRITRLDAAARKQLRANPAARAFFDAQPPGYRRVASHWVMSAKRESTRQRRLAQLIADAAAGRRLRQLTSPAKRPKA